MLKNPIFLVSVAFVILTLLPVFPAPSAQAAPPAIEIPPELAQANLLGIHKKQIQARVKYWKDLLTNTSDTATVVKIRVTMLGRKDYGLLYDSVIYQNAYAKECASQMMGLLSGKAIPQTNSDRLKELKRLNVAMILSNMHQEPTLPAMYYMIRSHNQALRYLGWKGLVGTRKILLQSGRENVAKFIAVVKENLPKETNPLILEQTFTVMDFSGPEAAVISESTRKTVQQAFLPILQKAWDNYRTLLKETTAKPADDKKKIDGDVLAVALAKGIDALAGIGKNLKNPKDTTTILQMTLNMADSAAKAYDKALGEEKNKKTIKALAKLLLTCETAMNTTASLTQKYIDTALKVKNPEERGPAVRSAVIVQWGDQLKKVGVKDVTPIKASRKTPAAKPVTPIAPVAPIAPAAPAKTPAKK